jgi:hypothetical protein
VAAAALRRAAPGERGPGLPARDTWRAALTFYVLFDRSSQQSRLFRIRRAGRGARRARGPLIWRTANSPRAGARPLAPEPPGRADRGAPPVFRVAGPVTGGAASVENLRRPNAPRRRRRRAGGRAGAVWSAPRRSHAHRMCTRAAAPGATGRGARGRAAGARPRASLASPGATTRSPASSRRAPVRVTSPTAAKKARGLAAGGAAAAGLAPAGQARARSAARRACSRRGGAGAAGAPRAARRPRPKPARRPRPLPRPIFAQVPSLRACGRQGRMQVNYAAGQDGARARAGAAADAAACPRAPLAAPRAQEGGGVAGELESLQPGLAEGCVQRPPPETSFGRGEALWQQAWRDCGALHGHPGLEGPGGAWGRAARVGARALSWQRGWRVARLPGSRPRPTCPAVCVTPGSRSAAAG